MKERNKGEINEQYLFHGSRTTSPEEIAFSRYSKQTGKLMWGMEHTYRQTNVGNGAYLQAN